MRRLLLTALCLLPSLALADPPGITVDHAWSRPMPAGATGVVYLTISDSGAADSLIGVASPVAAKAELHESINDHGVMKMRGIASLPVAPGKRIVLAPAGFHIMLTGLKQALVPGMTFPVTLTFAHGGAVTATTIVQQQGAMPSMDHSGTGGMPMHDIPMHGTGSK